MNAHFHLRLPQRFFEAMIAQAWAELPSECCGIFAGRVMDGMGTISEHFPLVNALESPTEFESDARSMLNAHKAMRASGTDILAVYHSHPSSEPIPSKRDLERNYGENVVNIIIGLRTGSPEVRAWWLTAAGSSEAEWSVQD